MPISYELAKELKEAGFPQKDLRCSYCFEQNHESCTSCEDAVESVPTLSELIEACGIGFDNLVKAEHDWLCNVDEDTKTCLTSGSSPEEAVARLWLELKKRNEIPH